MNALGQPIDDGKSPINAKMTDVIEKVAPGVSRVSPWINLCRPA